MAVIRAGIRSLWLDPEPLMRLPLIIELADELLDKRRKLDGGSRTTRVIRAELASTQAHIEANPRLCFQLLSLWSDRDLFDDPETVPAALCRAFALASNRQSAEHWRDETRTALEGRYGQNAPRTKALMSFLNRQVAAA